MFVSCECCVLSGRGLCEGLITRPEEFYRAKPRKCGSPGPLGAIAPPGGGGGDDLICTTRVICHSIKYYEWGSLGCSEMRQ